MEVKSLPVWLTAELAAQYAGGINAKYIRKLWAMGKLRCSQPDLGQRVTKREWIDEYLESCELKPDRYTEERIDRALRKVLYE